MSTRYSDFVQLLGLPLVMVLVVMNESVLLNSHWLWIWSSWKSTTEEDMVPDGWWSEINTIDSYWIGVLWCPLMFFLKVEFSMSPFKADGRKDILMVYFLTDWYLMQYVKWVGIGNRLLESTLWKILWMLAIKKPFPTRRLEM